MNVNKIVVILLLIFKINLILISQTTFSIAVDAVNSIEYGIELVYIDNDYYVVGKGNIKDTLFQTFTNHDYLSILDTSQIIKNTSIMSHFFTTHYLSSYNDTLYLFGSDQREEFIKWNVYKFKTNGDSLDLLVYDKFETNNVGGFSMEVIGDYIYLAGTIYKNSEADVLIVKMDKYGNIIKENNFIEFANPKYSNVLRDMCTTKDNNFAFVNFYSGVPFLQDTNFTTSNDYVSVCKFDQNLDTIWTKEILETGDNNITINGFPHVIGTPDSGIVVSTAMDIIDSIIHIPYYRYYHEFPLIFFKFNKEGIMEWSDTMYEYKVDTSVLLGVGPIKTIYKLFGTKNGDIIAAGKVNNIVDEPNTKAWMCRYDTKGNIKWQHTYNDIEYFADYAFLIDVEEAENGDIICVGGLQTEIGDKYNTDYTWLLRVDSNGCYSPGCLLGDTITAVLTKIEEVAPDIELPRVIKIYPNPTSEFINIELPKDIKWKKWSIHNIEGEKIKSGDFIEHSNILKKINIDVSSITPSIYFLLTKDENGKVGIGKFIVE